MTESADQAPTTRVRGGPRSKRGRRALGVLLVVWAVPVVAGFLFVFLPPFETVSAVLAAIVTSLSLFMVVPAVIGLGLAIAVWRLRWRWSAGAVLVVTILALSTAVVPWVDSSRTASANNVGLSLPVYLGAHPDRRGPDSTEVYNTVGGERLRLDVWRPPRPAPGNPAILWVHGGAWIHGHRGQNPNRAQWFADHGYAVFDIDYRLSPPPRWKEQTSDVKCALGWVHEHAAQYGINKDAVSIGGDSAGANLAMLAAYTAGTGQFAPSCASPEVGVKSVISFYGPTDTGALTRDSETPSLVRRTEREHFGGTRATSPETFRLTSPSTYARPGLPPTLLVQGKNDHIVPRSQATSLSTTLSAAGVPHRLLVVPWAEHAFDTMWGTWATQTAYGTTGQFLHAYALPGES